VSFESLNFDRSVLNEEQPVNKNLKTRQNPSAKEAEKGRKVLLEKP
jgi:hypothetical protein